MLLLLRLSLLLPCNRTLNAPGSHDGNSELRMPRVVS
jgi:hypothetical protein